MTWLASILLLGLFACICRRSLRQGLLAFAASLPLYLVRLQLGPIPTTLLELEWVVLVLFWLSTYEYQEVRPRILLRMLQERVAGRARPLIHLLLLGAVLMLAGALLGLSQTADLAGALNVTKSYFVEPMLLALMIWSVEYQRPMGTRQVLNHSIIDYVIALCIPAILVSLVALFQGATGLALPATWALEARATSFYPYPNAVGHFLAPLVVLSFLSLLSRKIIIKPWQQHVLLATVLLGTIAVVLARTEAALVAMVAAVLCALPLGRARHLTIPTALAAVALLFLIPTTRVPILEKLTLQDWSGQTRLAQWDETAHFLTQTPQAFFLGAGPNNYPVAIAPFHTHTYLEIFQYPHNNALNIWVENGLLGLIGFFCLLGALSLYPVRFYKRGFVVPLAAAMLTTCIHGLVDVQYFKNDLAMLTWIVIALACVTIRRRHGVDDDPEHAPTLLLS